MTEKKEKKQEQKQESAKDHKDVEIEKLTKIQCELTCLVQRLQADFENYKKRVEKEHQKLIEYSYQEFIKSLLPILDTFEQALKNTENNDVKEIHRQLWHTLSSSGLSKIDVHGKKFDPYFHEVMLSEKSDKEEGTILEELQTGYRFKNNVIRHTKVKVAKR